MPKLGDVLLVAVLEGLRTARWAWPPTPPDLTDAITTFQRARVFNGDRSTVNTHVWVQSQADRTLRWSLPLNELGTTWVPEGDEEALVAMIALRALAGLPPVKR